MSRQIRDFGLAIDRLVDFDLVIEVLKDVAIMLTDWVAAASPEPGAMKEVECLIRAACNWMSETARRPSYETDSLHISAYITVILTACEVGLKEPIQVEAETELKANLRKRWLQVADAALEFIGIVCSGPNGFGTFRIEDNVNIRCMLC